MPQLSSHLHSHRLPQRAQTPRRHGSRKPEIVRELDHELSVEADGADRVRITINGTSEALTANEAARFGAMIIETARRAGAVV